MRVLIHLFIADKYRYLLLIKNKQDIKIFASKLLNNNDIALLTSIGIFIFHVNSSFNQNNQRSITLNYFYYIQNSEESITKINEYLKVDKKVINNDELIYGWVSYIKDNREDFLKHGAKLLMFAIKIHDFELMDEIYKKCLKLFKQEF